MLEYIFNYKFVVFTIRQKSSQKSIDLNFIRFLSIYWLFSVNWNVNVIIKIFRSRKFYCGKMTSLRNFISMFIVHGAIVRPENPSHQQQFNSFSNQNLYSSNKIMHEHLWSGFIQIILYLGLSPTLEVM